MAVVVVAVAVAVVLGLGVVVVFVISAHLVVAGASHHQKTHVAEVRGGVQQMCVEEEINAGRWGKGRALHGERELRKGR